MITDLKQLAEGPSIYNRKWLFTLTKEELRQLALQRPDNVVQFGKYLNVLFDERVDDFVPGMRVAIDRYFGHGMQTKLFDILPADCYGEWDPDDCAADDESAYQRGLLSWLTPLAAWVSVPGEESHFSSWALYRLRNAFGVEFVMFTYRTDNDESPTAFFYPFGVVPD